MNQSNDEKNAKRRARYAERKEATARKLEELRQTRPSSPYLLSSPATIMRRGTTKKVKNAEKYADSILSWLSKKGAQ